MSGEVKYPKLYNLFWIRRVVVSHPLIPVPAAGVASGRARVDGSDAVADSLQELKVVYGWLYITFGCSDQVNN